jgi:hypothetical protein
MVRYEGSVARTLDFDDRTADKRLVPISAVNRARRLGLLRGPDRYKTLEKRRRAAQIRARHALDLIDLMDQTCRGR